MQFGDLERHARVYREGRKIESVALELLQSRGFCMLKVPGAWPDDRGQREQELRHSLHHKVRRLERRLEGVRRTVLEVLLEEVLVDVPGEDTRRRSPISRDVSFSSSRDVK